MKFNTKTTTTTVNYEGEKAYKLNPAMDLYVAVVTTALSDQFYEPTDARLQRIVELVAKNKPQFVAQLAVYARQKMYLRSIPLVLAVELAKIHNGDDLVSRTVNQIVQRADEITELLACYAQANQRQGTKQLGKLSKQLQKGLQDAFNRFDEYQFAKYNRDGAVKLRDALFLVHPKAKDEAQQGIFDRIVKDELQVPYTWEVELSALGQQAFATPADKKAAFTAKWEELIDSNKVGYMALLRNLRNILEAEVSKKHIDKVIDTLTNPQQVQKAKQFPFRFFAAYRELQSVVSGYTTHILKALDKAILLSVSNIQGFDDKTKVVLACDVSGSMRQPISQKSRILNYDVGLVLAMLLQNRCTHVVTGIFGNTWEVINLPNDNVLANVDSIYKMDGRVGYSTNAYLVLKDLIARRYKADKVMFFTDCQLWNSNGTQESLATLWANYKAQIAPDAQLYLFDLAGYGKQPLAMPQKDVFLIGGWSDRIFEVLEAIQNGGTVLGEVRKVEV